MSDLIGERALARKLEQLPKAVRGRIGRQAAMGAMRVVAKSIKSQIPSRYKDARRAIGASVKRARGTGPTLAKAGAAVGKRTGAQRDRGNRPGVGISRLNLHWFILGSGRRVVKSTGRTAGVLPPILAGIVQRGRRAAEPMAAAKLAELLRAGIAREAAKRNAGG